MTWNSPQLVLTAGGPYGGSSVCDPSVVRYNGVYFLYHTCINAEDVYQSPPVPDGYHNNRICVAVADAIGGPYYRLDQPIIQDLNCPPNDRERFYCVGQP